MTVPSFDSWLLDQQKRMDTVGQLAAAAAVDTEFPTEGDYGDHRYYLLTQNASDLALLALHRAWHEWDRQNQRQQTVDEIC